MKLIQIGKNGLHPREVKAVSQMEQHFQDSWQAYSSLVVTDEQGAMEIDLLIITQDRILLVEIKDWNGNLTSYRGEWRLNDKSRGKSPFSIKKEHALRIGKLLSNQLRSKIGYGPMIEAHVVLSGSATPEQLPPNEARYVHTLDTFLKIRKPSFYSELCTQPERSHEAFFERHSHPRPNSETALKEIDHFFCNSKGYVQPKRLKVAQYISSDELEWEHNNGLFKEFKGTNPSMEKDIGLLRQWDFLKLGTGLAFTDTWSRILTREHVIHCRARTENSRLEQFMLRPAVGLDPEDIQTDYAEAFELRHNMKRFDRYLNQYGPTWTPDQRADHVRALLAPFAELHGMGMAHRDVDCHNLWYAADNATIVTSGYYASFIPEQTTVKDIRALLKSTQLQLPEDVFSESGDILDPFRVDVFLLGQIAHRICFDNKRLEREEQISVWRAHSSDDPFNGQLDEFFAKALDWEVAHRYKDAGEMLAHFNSLTDNHEHIYDDSEEVIDALTNGNFIKHQMSALHLTMMFPQVQGESISFGPTIRYRYQDGDAIGLIKFWQNVVISPKDPGTNRRILRLRKRIEKTLDAGLPIAQVRDYGLLEGGGFYIATRYEPGDSWSKFVQGLSSTEDRLRVAKRLCDAMLALHKQDVYHGDLHPENVIFKEAAEDVSEQNRELILIDVLDYGGESEPYNVSYGPNNPACTDGYGRDRFAVYLMVSELFCDDLPAPIAEELERAQQQSDQVPLSLKPLLDAIEVAIQPEEVATAIAPARTFNLAFLLSDLPLEKELVSKEECGYFVKAREAREPNWLRFFITGIDTRITLTVDLMAKQIKYAKVTRNISLSDYISARKEAHHRITENITLIRGEPKKVFPDPFVDYLLGIDEVIDLMIKQSPNKGYDELEHEIHPEDCCTVAPKQIWNTLLNTEGDYLLRLEVAEGVVQENSAGHLLIPYISNSQSWLDNFDRGDTVNVTLGNDEHSFGSLVLGEILSDTLVVKPSRGGMIRRLVPGNEIILESLRTKSSRDRRTKALERVLDGRSNIAHLPDYFDKNAKIASKPMADVPSEATIRALYDNLDGGAEHFNERQLDAFQRVITEGPISVLQGPPGTGKTAFISKLIHYLYEKDLAKNILLVGQSNATVDNVALKARELCQTMGTPLTVVRVGNEGSVDSQLLHAHPSAIQRKIQNKFHREYDLRINALASRLMLSQGFVSTLSGLHRTLHPIMANLRTLKVQLQKIEHLGAQSNLTEKREALLEQVNTTVQHLMLIVDSYQFSFETPDAHDSDFWELLSKLVAREHDIIDLVSLKRLNQLIILSHEWIDVLASGDANYDRFLVKTSQLVCGTLVGMGSKNLAINESEFDWVIVDEAARAQASELMIALQSAKRVLLVGDHRQLPPHYDKRHLKAVSHELSVQVSEVAKTDFERAFDVNNGITLDTQYRMIKPISDIISTCFYADEQGVGGLKTGRPESPEWFQALPYPLNCPVTWIDSGVGAKRTGEDNKGRRGYMNQHEAEVILHLIKLLCGQNTVNNLRQYVTDEKPYPIGVITMYQQQKAILKTELSKAEWAADIRELIKIDTVDSYQGQENRLIFLSLVRDNNKANQGFLGDTPRINVALSRAQERLVVVGARAMWRSGNSDSALAKVLSFVETQTQEQPEQYQVIDGTSVIESTQHA